MILLVIYVVRCDVVHIFVIDHEVSRYELILFVELDFEGHVVAVMKEHCSVSLFQVDP